MMTPSSSRLSTLQEIAQEAQIPASWLYDRSRRDALPGQCRIGKYVRIDRDVFFEALKEGKLK